MFSSFQPDLGWKYMVDKQLAFQTRRLQLRCVHDWLLSLYFIRNEPKTPHRTTDNGVPPTHFCDYAGRKSKGLTAFTVARYEP
jgi:hypothetical protein